MTAPSLKLPYFDRLLTLLDQGHPELELAFGRHVHWGYWPNPEQALNSPEDFSKATEQLSREVYGAAAVQNGQSVLDVGCGLGGTIASLNEQFSHLNLVGLNIDERQLEVARKKTVPQQGNTLRFVSGSASALPFPDQSFDVVLAVECIFHFPDRRQFFQEAFRVLKPGGRISLSDFVPQDFLLPGIWCNSNVFGTGFYGGFDIGYTATRYRKLADEIGFRCLVERDITVHTLPTYKFLWTLNQVLKLNDFSAFWQTFTLERISYWRWLCYMIFSFVKDGTHTQVE